jgi:hypothetical protein
VGLVPIKKLMIKLNNKNFNPDLTPALFDRILGLKIIELESNLVFMGVFCGCRLKIILKSAVPKTVRDS